MARITVEDCLQKVNNRFALIHMAAKRVRQLRKGAEPMVVSKNRDVVISLREIAAGKVLKGEGVAQQSLLSDNEDQLLEEPKGEGLEEAPDAEKGGPPDA
ncbi:MAG: DNA-directed RNA polymerase subunit omega [Deltaproteobacteria bacterium]|nr:MAG: DNA-directed RNA polymerase subunit omega [Deltaproteobacteria bacterium]